MMNRTDLCRRLVAKLKDEAVIGGIGYTNFDLFVAGHRPQNFYMLGSMGLACSIALGVALAQPERGVIALEGDGSLLMNLGVLGTIAQLKPRNLTIVVFDNGAYQITGGQPAPTRDVADIVAIAKASGLHKSVWARDGADFEALIAGGLNDGDPRLIGCKVDSSAPSGQTVRDPALIRSRFMKGLGTGRAGSLDA
jgi:thiamine pyrophosphate-dependent acetolactate synthase large subunit-like protein